MAVTVRNIIVGPADLWVAPTGTAAPAFVASDGYRAAFDGDGNWDALGATMEGVEVSYQPDYGEIIVDQLKDAARLFNQGLTVQVNTQLAEATLENLLVAWGVDDNALISGTTFEIAVPDSDPVERALAFVGEAPDDSDGKEVERLYHCFRCISIEGSTVALRRTEATVFPVTFRLLADPNQTTTNQIGGENRAKYADVIDSVRSV